MIISAKKLRRIINKEFLVQWLLICIARANMNDDCRYLFSLKEKEKRSFLNNYHINQTMYVYVLTRSFKYACVNNQSTWGASCVESGSAVILG